MRAPNMIGLLLIVMVSAPASAQTVPVPVSTTDWYRLGETGMALATPVVYFTVPKPGLQKLAGDYETLLGKAKAPTNLQTNCRQAREQLGGMLAAQTDSEYEDAFKAKVLPGMEMCLSKLMEWVTSRPRERFYIQLGLINFHLYYMPKLAEAYPEPIKKTVTEMLVSLDGISDPRNDTYKELCPVAKEGLVHLAAFGGQATDPLGGGLSLEQIKGVQDEAIKLRGLILDGKHRC